jgi:hypothetical protein
MELRTQDLDEQDDLRPDDPQEPDRADPRGAEPSATRQDAERPAVRDGPGDLRRVLADVAAAGGAEASIGRQR